MIVTHSTTPSAVDILHKSQYLFFLGGSRRMADRYDDVYGNCSDSCLPTSCASPRPNFRIAVSEDTDYDFYATHTNDLESHLLSEGFDYSTANEYYLDTECISILCKDNVQVVLRNNAEFYTTVFENIDLEVYYHYLWKSSPEQPSQALIGNIFNMLFKIAHATKGV